MENNTDAFRRAIAAMPPRRLFGVSEVWRPNSTGTRDFYLFGLRISRRNFRHSTALFD